MYGLTVAMAESMTALRGYLRELRIQKSVSQDELARQMGLSRRALIDWEMGTTATLKSGPLFRAVAFLRASVDDVRKLLSDDTLSEEDGKRAAQELVAAGMTDTELKAAISLLDRLRSDPQSLARWMGYGDRLLEETDVQPLSAEHLTNRRSRE